MRLRIAQVAPLSLPVPPRHYGGTERVVYDLTEELVTRGHEVTLFASGDSKTSARLVPVVPRSLWREKVPYDPLAALFRMHEELFRRAHEFDLIHTHTDFFALPYTARSPTPVITTLHGRLDFPDVPEVLHLFPRANLVAISRSQQAQAPRASWAGAVHHGLPLDRYRFDDRGGDDLIFLGRFTPDKAPHVAIDIAVAAGVPITIAGRIEPGQRHYFERVVRPRLAHPLVRFVGEASDRQKQKLLGSARALLFPIDWPEPFGLVMAEAMACGTPVIARPKGAAPEVVMDGVTGILADDRDSLIRAVDAVQRIDRAACRRHVEENFSVAAMADRYESIYRDRIARRLTAPPGSRPDPRVKAA
jgi:glycosyltransferase involved in cell wall biosynthesis